MEKRVIKANEDALESLAGFSEVEEMGRFELAQSSDTDSSPTVVGMPSASDTDAEKWLVLLNAHKV